MRLLPEEVAKVLESRGLEDRASLAPKSPTAASQEADVPRLQPVNNAPRAAPVPEIPVWFSAYPLAALPWISASFAADSRHRGVKATARPSPVTGIDTHHQ
jgi:hypothetical protein